jgi:hypothetical protein
LPSFYSSRHDRTDIHCKIEYSLDLSSQDTSEAVIENVSESGFSLITDRPLDVGDEITIKTPLYMKSQSAVVRWIIPDENGYKVGLEFR